jgi:general secretion pathway protein E
MAADIGSDVDLSRLAEEIPDAGDLMDAEDDAPIIRLINAILSEAVREKASDVHIETFEDKLSVRYRIDGVLSEVLSPKRLLGPLLVSRLKVMARLDIAEKRVPQDGRISVRIAGHAVDIRMSTCPRPTASAWCCACSTSSPGSCSWPSWRCPRPYWPASSARCTVPTGSSW